MEEHGVEHIVLLRFGASCTKTDFDTFIEASKGLIKIPGVVSISVGTSFVDMAWMSDRRGGYTHALRVRLKSKADLRVYDTHPIHVDAKKKFLPLLDSTNSNNGPPILAIDWESEVIHSEE